jgi:nucleotide-binding universal stress UspA family protein
MEHGKLTNSAQELKMILLKRILVPIDFSEFSNAALQYGCELAERFGAELHLLHVLQDMVAMVPEPGLAFPPPGNYWAELQASSDKALNQLLDLSWEEGKQVVRKTSQGVPFLEIVRYAKKNEIDLIVIGTHGRTGLAHVLLGSVAEKVVRKAPCPVLTVRSSQHQFVMP